MSSTAFPPKPAHRHTQSADSAKFEEALAAQVGEPSSEIFYPHDDHSTFYPNNWAKIRLATGIMYYCP
jgi:hypothetical protein